MKPADNTPEFEIIAVDLPTDFGTFILKLFINANTQDETLVLQKGSIDPNQPTILRMHSSCVTGDIWHSKRCDCGPQLHAAMQYINTHGGLIIYLQQEGRGIGLKNKLKAYQLQQQGLDTFDANTALGFAPDARKYDTAGQILKTLNIQTIHLLTNNPQKQSALESLGFTVSKRIPLEIPANENNKHYLQTKKNKFGHLLNQKF
jgi:3,4-dihydroxy 2-butanone 4-phosphate synthase/GTP cyclohydrolase II